jgi:hypothetical protein
MILNKRSSLFLFGILLVFISNAQNENAKWYFGGAGLDFLINPPTILTNNAQGTLEGCATISDASGNLLFYTDGITVYNSQHTMMANGTGLKGHMSSTQSALIVKKPGSSSLYYIFTTDAGSGVSTLHYSIVDMTLAAGLGSVTTKNFLLDSTTTEKVTAVRHCNDEDVWILAHDWHNFDYTAFLLNIGGVNSNPVISYSVGVSQPFTNSWFFQVGCLKASPNGMKVAACSGSIVQLCDFNGVTGQVSNPIALGPVQRGSYGCEFSPDGSKLYASEAYSVTSNSLYQWDLCAGSNAAIVASQTVIGTVANNALGTLQRAINGKIYVAIVNQNSIGVINNPNSYGSACNFVSNGQSVAPKTCQYGIQNIINDFANTSSAPCVSVQDCNTVLLPEQQSMNENPFRIFPNPVNRIFKIDINVPVKLIIFNLLGCIVFEDSFEAGKQTVNIASLTTGIYNVRVVSEQQVKTFRIIKAD